MTDTTSKPLVLQIAEAAGISADDGFNPSLSRWTVRRLTHAAYLILTEPRSPGYIRDILSEEIPEVARQLGVRAEFRSARPVDRELAVDIIRLLNTLAGTRYPAEVASALEPLIS